MDLASIQPMLATSAPPFTRAGWLFEFKYDGYRLLATKTQLLTRNKRDATGWYPELVGALGRLRGSFVLDGEVCLVDASGIPDFEAMRGRARRPDLQLNYYAFDVLFLGGRDLRELPLLERKRRLRALLPKEHPHIGYVAHVEEAGEALFAHAVAIGLEGVVGKRAASRYVGGRSRDWRKAKAPGYHDGWGRPLRTR